MTLRRISVAPNQVRRWQPDRQGAFVAPGDYLLGSSRHPWRKAAGGIVVDIPGKWNLALYPDTLYTKRKIDGLLPVELALFGRRKRPRSFSDAGDLYPWQRQGLADTEEFLEAGLPAHFGMVVDMGGGKTRFGLELARPFRPEQSIIVAPTYLHSTWRREADKWHVGCPILTTYESLRKYLDTEPMLLYFDEVFYLGNPSTNRFQVAQEFGRRVPVMFGVTGTPRSVSPMQLRWNCALYPGCIPESDSAFRAAYGLDTEVAEHQGRKHYVTTKWNLSALADDLQVVMRTIDTSEIMKSVPECVKIRVPVPAPSRYRMIVAGAASTSGSSSKVRAQALQASDGHVVFDNGVVQHIGSEKIDAAVAHMEEALMLGEPVIAIAHWRETQARLADRLSKYQPVCVLGDDPGEVDISRFLDGETKVLIVSASKACGLNPQEICNREYWLSASTSPLMRKQGVKRIHRPGQKRISYVFDFIAEGTLDEARLNLIEQHEDETGEFVDAALEAEMFRMFPELKDKVKFDGVKESEE